MSIGRLCQRSVGNSTLKEMCVAQVGGGGLLLEGSSVAILENCAVHSCTAWLGNAPPINAWLGIDASVRNA
eukprot:5931735-Pleurochrysis_carterae.AAC.1